MRVLEDLLCSLSENKNLAHSVDTQLIGLDNGELAFCLGRNTSQILKLSQQNCQPCVPSVLCLNLMALTLTDNIEIQHYKPLLEGLTVT